MSQMHDSNLKIQDTLKDFTNKCTIVGLSQVANRRSLILRVMWALTAVAGLCIAVWQTWGVIKEYFEHKVIMKSEWRTESLQLLPAITICAFQSTEEDSDERAKEVYDNERNWHPKKFQLENKTNKYLDAFHAVVDWNGGLYVIDSTIQEHGINQEAIDGWNRLHLTFSKHEDEQCFTFNSAINSTQWIRSPPYTGVTFYVFRNQSRNNSESKTAMLMEMSTPGVAPTCESGDGSAITLEMGNYYIASIEWEETTRIPNRSPSDCVPSEGKNQLTSVYYTNDLQYKYSIEACTKTMMQNVSLRFCNCYIPTIPVNYLADDYPNARPCESTCAHVLNMTNIFDKCGVPCWEMSFRTTIQRIPLLFFQNDLVKDMKTLQDRLNYSVIFTTDDAKSRNSAPNSNDYGADQGLAEPTSDAELFSSYFTSYLHNFLKEESVMIKVQVQSPLMSVIYETPKYSLSDFWGVVGGNLGLWLGVSAVSIAELVELFLIICSQLFKKFTRSDEVSPQKSKQPTAHVMEVYENSK